MNKNILIWILFLLVTVSSALASPIENSSEGYYADKYWYNAYFKEQSTDYPFVKMIPKHDNIGTNSERIIIQPVNMFYYNGAEDEIISNVRTVNATVNGSSIKYINAYTTSNDVLDMEFAYNPTQLKENLYLKNKDFSEPSLTGTVYLAFKNKIEYNRDKLALYADGSWKTSNFDDATSLELKRKADNKTIWKFATIDATDDNNVTINGTYKGIFKNYGIELIMKIDYNWINDSGRAFPVVIDPTLIVNDTASEDIKVDSNNPDINYEGENLSVGGGTISYLKFNLSEYDFDIISSATLNLYKTNTVDNETVIAYYSNDDNWDETMTYNSGQPSGNWTTQNSANVTNSTGWFSIDVSDSVINTWDGDKVLTLKISSSSSQAITFYDTEASGYKPYLNIIDPVDCSAYCTNQTNYWECTGSMSCNYLDATKSIWVHGASISGEGADGSPATDGLIRMNSSSGWVNISDSTLDGYGGAGTTGDVGGDGGDGKVYIYSLTPSKIHNSTLNGYGGNGGTGTSDSNGHGGRGGQGNLTTDSDYLMVNISKLNGDGGNAGFGQNEQWYGGDGYAKLEFNISDILNSNISGIGGRSGGGYEISTDQGIAGDGYLEIYSIGSFLIDGSNLYGNGGLGLTSYEHPGWGGRGSIYINSTASDIDIIDSVLNATGGDTGATGGGDGGSGNMTIYTSSAEFNITSSSLLSYGGKGKYATNAGDSFMTFKFSKLLTDLSTLIKQEYRWDDLGAYASQKGYIEAIDELTFKENATIYGRSPDSGYNIFNITTSSPKLGLFNTYIPYRYYVYCGGNLTVGRSGRTDQNLTFDSSCGTITNVTEEEYFAAPANIAPTIVSVSPDVSYDPVENSDTPINISFIADDEDGVGDLNDTSARIAVNKSGVSHTSTSCSPSDLNSTATNYTCTINMDYYDEAGTWSVNASVQDMNQSLVYNDTETFNYNLLKAMSITNKPIDFGSVSVNVGTNSNNLSVKNTGNVQFNVNATGANLTYSSYTIPVDDMKWDTDSDASDGTTLTESSQQILTNMDGSNINYIWHYILVDETNLVTGSYSGTFVFNAI